MPIGAGGTFGGLLVLGLALGATTVAAQTAAGGTWTDPPARSAPPAAAVATPTPSAGSAAKARETGSSESKAEFKGGTKAGTVAESKPRAIPATLPRRDAGRTREAARARPSIAADATPARTARARVVERRAPLRPAPRRVVRSFVPYDDAARPSAFDPRPIPVGRVNGAGYGERNPVFDDDRMSRIAAAQAAGYLVVRSRSVQFPDGRTLRSYRPYQDEDLFD